MKKLKKMTKKDIVNMIKDIRKEIDTFNKHVKELPFCSEKNEFKNWIRINRSRVNKLEKVLTTGTWSLEEE